MFKLTYKDKEVEYFNDVINSDFNTETRMLYVWHTPYGHTAPVLDMINLDVIARITEYDETKHDK